MTSMPCRLSSTCTNTALAESPVQRLSTVAAGRYRYCIMKKLANRAAVMMAYRLIEAVTMARLVSRIIR